jgi:hypothetical protein
VLVVAADLDLVAALDQTDEAVDAEAALEEHRPRFADRPQHRIDKHPHGKGLALALFLLDLAQLADERRPIL